LKLGDGVSGYVYIRVWIRLPTNQGLKPVWVKVVIFIIISSESDFQQIKDWNLLLEWFRSMENPRLNPTSNKSRIETLFRRRSYLKSNRVWIRLPTNQGLKRELGLTTWRVRIGLNPTSNKSRIETKTLNISTIYFHPCLNPTSNKSRIETKRK